MELVSSLDRAYGYIEVDELNREGFMASDFGQLDVLPGDPFSYDANCIQHYQRDDIYRRSKVEYSTLELDPIHTCCNLKRLFMAAWDSVSHFHRT